MTSSLIFLPDISGFTNFVHSTEKEHSQHIIAELLETIIDAEELNLKMEEIEGDAIFYFMDQIIPSPEALFSQVKNMYVSFHDQLQLYEHQRICDCGACSTASSLNLKFFAHAGDLEFITVKNKKRAYGRDVIQAHRLMKNNVPIDNYLLISEGMLEAWENLGINFTIPEELIAQDSEYKYDLGLVKYKYFDLTPFNEYISPPPSLNEIPESNYFIRGSRKIKSSPKELYELISNFKYRASWNTDPLEFKYDENRVNRVGTKHLCVINSKQSFEFETVTRNLGENKMVYGERTDCFPILKNVITYFIIEEDGGHSILTLEIHPQNPNFFQRLAIPLIKMIFSKKLLGGLDNIKNLAESEMVVYEEV